MKITFPHMGNVYIAAKALLDGLGVEYVIPPANNNKALEIGALYSPDEMCLPFKIQIGNYIQSIEQGADTIIITGSCGPCRFGEYCELQINILKKLGYKLNFIVIDSPNDIGKKELLNRLSSIASESTKNTIGKLGAMKDALRVISLIEKIEEKAHFLSGYEINKGECKKLLKECKEEVMEWDSPKSMISLLKYYNDRFDKLKIDKNKDPIKIAIIGEIYTIIEPFSNFYIEDKLMDYGVSISRKLTPSWWVKDLVLSPLGLNSISLRIAAKKYLMPKCIGGHGMECIGEAVLAQKNGYDGAIQIFPMGCMPEIVSKAILSKISQDKDFPIMTLIVDEMTGEAGYVTRLEAFVDLLERRKDKNVLSWG